jgi:hypothetical protein
MRAGAGVEPWQEYSALSFMSSKMLHPPSSLSEYETRLRVDLGNRVLRPIELVPDKILVTYLRDLFGDVFPLVTVAPAWLTPSVTNLATAAYDTRILPAGALDNARLVILADALEETGCTDADMLSHLREPGPHVRGCWVVDLLLGKE